MEKQKQHTCNMKRILLILITASFSLYGFGQAKKTPPKQTPATSGGMTTQKASSIIEYTNSVQSLLSEYLPVIGLFQGAEVLNESYANKHYDILDLQRLYKPYKESLQEYISEKKSNPTIPHAAINTADKTFLSQAFGEQEKQLNSIGSDINRLVYLVDDQSLELKNKKDKTEADALVLNVNKNLEALQNTREKIYDKIDEIGITAEEVILQKHPLKVEIIDMKKCLNKAGKIRQAGYQDDETIKKNSIEISQLTEELKTIVVKYESYKTKDNVYSKSEDMKHSMKIFYEHTKHFIGKTNQLLADSKKSKIDDDQMDGDRIDLKEAYDLMLAEYNTFVDINNE